MPRTCVVTGANGFLGLNLVEQLTRLGWRVTALCQPGSERRIVRRFPVDIVEADILDLQSVRRAIPEQVDAVFHTAASTSLWSRQRRQQMMVNADGTRNVAAVCLEKCVQCLIHTSTWNTYGIGYAVVCEATPQTGGSSSIPYVKSKFLAEREVRRAGERGLAWVIFNPCHIIGRYDTRNWGRMFQMVAHSALPGVPPAKGCFCHAEAVAAAEIVAVDRARRGENYLLPGVEATFAEVTCRIAALLGKPPPRYRIPIPLFRLLAKAKVAIAAISGREPNLTPEGVELMLNEPRFETDKAERELGYRRISLHAMLEDAYTWLVAEGLLPATAGGPR